MTATIEAMARTCHEVNRVYCEAIGDPAVHWIEAPDDQVASTCDGVRYVLEHPDGGDDACHENWRRTKAAAGWSYGAVKSVPLKEHPCMVPFAQLPPAQKLKDRLFRVVVLSMAEIG